jgi:hypothetical protein
MKKDEELWVMKEDSLSVLFALDGDGIRYFRKRDLYMRDNGLQQL